MGEIVRKRRIFSTKYKPLKLEQSSCLYLIFIKVFAAIETNIISKLIMKLIPEGELFIFYVFCFNILINKHQTSP